MEKCCLCGKELKRMGNNAEPIKKGKCCDRCNDLLVVKERLNMMYRGGKNNG